MKENLAKGTFLLLLLASVLPWCGPAAALAGGILFSILIGNPWPKQTASWSKKLLQLSVVGLGFGVNIGEIWQTGREAMLFTPISIAATVAVGIALGRLLQVSSKTSTLISFGTAICGGSAIAAMAPVIKAENDDVAVSLATVFSLNAAALLVFPPLGHMLALSQHQFGVWAALAIHDTSSVVGASSAFGGAALAVGTTVKLARAVWISPSVLIGARLAKSGARSTFPLFILGFIAATTIRSFLPQLARLWEICSVSARQGLVVTLFLVGNGLTLEVLKRVGARPMIQGVALWIVVSIATLAAILAGVI